MANAILGKSGFASVAQHYQSQARLDPVGTRAEIHAVAGHMARTDPGHAAAFQQHMAKALPGLPPKQGPADPVVGDAQTPPAWKSGEFAAQPGAWTGFNQAVAGLPNASPTEKFAYGQIYAAEGGNIKDPRGSASSGIVQKTLDNARSRVPGQDPQRPQPGPTRRHLPRLPRSGASWRRQASGFGPDRQYRSRHGFGRYGLPLRAERRDTDCSNGD